MDLLPKVFRTEGSITEFDPSKIFESIIKETGMSETDAKNITELVVRRIISSGIKFLSGPHIREIVCSILSEQHFENERKLYTRIGMPLMDYEELLEKESGTTLNIWINPEKINHSSANQIAEEYAHLRILSNEESKAHLYGDIHINGLRYFNLRPFTQMWDPRIILNNGFPPFYSLNNPFKQDPPKDLISALSQILRWFETVQNEFYGTQGLNLFSLFLAPYVTNLSKEKLKQEIRKLISEINLLPIITGREIPLIKITSSNSILKSFSKLPTINPKGKINDNYSDYHNECTELFKTLIFIFKEISGYNLHYPIIKFQILVNNKFFEVIETNYSNFWDEIYTFKNLFSIDFCFAPYYNKNLEKIAEKRIYNFGTLQSITLNLPRYAYNSQDEEIFLEILHSKVKLCSGILLKKYEMIEKRLKLKHLPCCSSSINNEPLFKLENQDLSFSLVGLNESIKILTNYELHQNPDAVKLGMKILNELNNICNELSVTHGKNFLLSENVSEKAIKRFSKLDLRLIPEGLRKISTNLNREYTNSIHFRNDVEVELFKRIEIQGEFHQYIKNGAIEYISLHDLENNNLSIQEFLNIISKKSPISSINFSS